MNQSSTDEYREFWASVDAAVEEVAKWPEWKIDRVQAARFANSDSGQRDCSKDRE